MRTVARPKQATKPESVCQVLIVLPNTDPLVWRRVQVPESYSFWDLHVAIQDAMGWKDYHLHEFTVVDSKTGLVNRIGIPDDEMPSERPCVSGWKVPIARYLHHGMDPVRYRYDFGDDWEHTLEFEAMAPATAAPTRAASLVQAPVHQRTSVGPMGTSSSCGSFATLVTQNMTSGCSGSAAASIRTPFTTASITFDNPRERWQMAFGDRGRAV